MGPGCPLREPEEQDRSEKEVDAIEYIIYDIGPRTYKDL